MNRNLALKVLKSMAEEQINRANRKSGWVTSEQNKLYSKLHKENAEAIYYAINKLKVGR